MGKQLLKGKVQVEVGKSTSDIFFTKGKMPTRVGNKQLSINFLLHMSPFFQLATVKVRAQSLKNGHQSAYSRAETKNIS